MQSFYDFSAQKKATNLSLNSELFKRTRAFKINLSATLEQALKDKLKSIEAKKWVKKLLAKIVELSEQKANCILSRLNNLL